MMEKSGPIGVIWLRALKQHELGVVLQVPDPYVGRGNGG
jgi:hypothetical protein